MYMLGKLRDSISVPHIRNVVGKPFVVAQTLEMRREVGRILVSFGSPIFGHVDDMLEFIPKATGHVASRMSGWTSNGGDNVLYILLDFVVIFRNDTDCIRLAQGINGIATGRDGIIRRREILHIFILKLLGICHCREVLDEDISRNGSRKIKLVES